MERNLHYHLGSPGPPSLQERSQRASRSHPQQQNSTGASSDRDTGNTLADSSQVDRAGYSAALPACPQPSHFEYLSSHLSYFFVFLQQLIEH